MKVAMVLFDIREDIVFHHLNAPRGNKENEEETIATKGQEKRGEEERRRWWKKVRTLSLTHERGDAK